MTAVGDLVAPFQTVDTPGRYQCTGPCDHEFYSDITGHKMPPTPPDCTGDGWVLSTLLPSGVLDQHKRDFLSAHTTGVLGTLRASGGPQMTQVGYVFDGGWLSICSERHLAKWRNASRNPAVTFWVGDGRRQLVVYGTATMLSTGPEHEAALRAYFDVIAAGAGIDPAAVAGWLREDRGIIRILPERVIASD